MFFGANSFETVQLSLKKELHIHKVLIFRIMERAKLINRLSRYKERCDILRQIYSNREKKIYAK